MTFKDIDLKYPRMSCEGELSIYDKKTGTLLTTIKCDKHAICLRSLIWGGNGVPGVGLGGAASQLSAYTPNQIDASFNSRCSAQVSETTTG